MKKLIFITLFFFFSVQNLINARTCYTPFSSLHLENLSLSAVMKAHTGDREHLGKWIHFFFSHFETGFSLVRYLERITDYALSSEESACFRRALTIYLLHYYAADIRRKSYNDSYITFYKNLFRDVDRFLVSEFLISINNAHIISLLNTIILKDTYVTKLKHDISPAKSLILIDRKGNATLLESQVNKYFYSGLSAFQSKFLDDLDTKPSVLEALAIRDFNLLAVLGLKDLYYNTDITDYVQGVMKTIEGSTRHFLKRRSKKYDLKIFKKNSRIFGNCLKNGENYHGSTDDLLASFFSTMKMKMVMGHTKFLNDFNMAVHRKSYKMLGLKGFRYLRQLLSRKNYNNFIKLYINHVSTELSFLTRDFQKLFGITAECQLTNGNRAGVLYFNIKHRNA